MYLIFDTETTGLPSNYKAPISDLANWPRCVQIAWQLHDLTGKLINNQNYIIKPENYDIPHNATKIHGITTERATKEGYDLAWVLTEFNKDLQRTKWVIGHNIEFDNKIVGAEFLRKKIANVLQNLEQVDTKNESTNYCAIPSGKGGRYKWPKLIELHEKLFGVGFDDAHDAAYDVSATAKCFFELIQKKIIKPLGDQPLTNIKYESPKLEHANFTQKPNQSRANNSSPKADSADIKDLEGKYFAHLHVHSQYSVLQATTEIGMMIKKAKQLGMKAVGLTDHNNMMGAFKFVQNALNEKIKPIVGCEFNICEDHKNKNRKDNGFQAVLMAKNKAGYHNLAKLSSCAFIDGFYYIPRIDKNLLVQYKKDLIATTGGLWGEVPYLILNVGENQAEEAFLWWKNLFGEDFYVEINRHEIEEEEIVNQTLLKFAQKHSVKYFASNNVYYLEKEESKAHDVLLCVKDGETIHKPKKYLGKRGKEFRYGFPNDEFYFKSSADMKKLFHDLPKAIECTEEITHKCEAYELSREVLLPKFEIPTKFQEPKDKEDNGKRGENVFLEYLTHQGAKKRYPNITPEIQERLNFELATIKRIGYPGYFLIVQDFCQAARDLGVSVGPGRGSVAGSAVAYCIGITNIDPIKYNLLFERFLNPDRVSLPDVDIDFDDEGRQKVIDYVTNKYGANQVAQIITYGTMAAKSAIRDTARVMELPLKDADYLAKLIPDITLKKLFNMESKELAGELKNNQDKIANAKKLKNIAEGNDDLSKVIKQALVIEGTIRNTGTHACGVIITPDDITKFIPITLAKDSNMYCTQFDNSTVENAGLLKMDFLGLKTLTLITNTCQIVKESRKEILDPDNFPIDNKPTYELFQRGETVGVFQYESAGMQKYLKELKPSEFSDLIAMNALYRPGPLEYIPSFIRRKHGQEPITYDLPEMEEFLKETYGITVYQEQVMLLSQKIADFTKGEADQLRKAMGKKEFALLKKLKPKFIKQGTEKGHPEKQLNKIWKDWEAFASYAFNKSHSTCYAWLAYLTAYLKANYPVEYMAAVLSNNMNDIKSLTFFLEECKRMDLSVLGPDANESGIKFTVNHKKQIRFGMAAIKGTGDAAVASIIEERNKNGNYKDIFDFSERVDLKTVNKKTFESLAMAGGFDCFQGYHRKQYLFSDDGNISLIEKAIKYGASKRVEANAAQISIFDNNPSIKIPAPKAALVEPYTKTEKLKIEKEVLGFFMSGHPLDEYKLELKSLCKPIKQLSQYMAQDIAIGGTLISFMEREGKKGPFGIFKLEDLEAETEMMLFDKNYLKFKHLLTTGSSLYVKGRVEHDFRDQSKTRLSPSFIGLLSHVKGKLFKGLSVKVPLHKLNESLCQELYQIFTSYPGNLPLHFTFSGEKHPGNNQEMRVETVSRKMKIEITPKLIKRLETIPSIEFSLLK